jgi:hypothetical protein
MMSGSAMTKWEIQALNGDPALHHIGADLVHDQRRAGDLVLHGVERLLGVFVLDQIHCPEHAQTADFTDGRVARWRTPNRQTVEVDSEIPVGVVKFRIVVLSLRCVGSPLGGSFSNPSAPANFQCARGRF